DQSLSECCAWLPPKVVAASRKKDARIRIFPALMILPLFAEGLVVIPGGIPAGISFPCPASFGVVQLIQQFLDSRIELAIAPTEPFADGPRDWNVYRPGVHLHGTAIGGSHFHERDPYR